MPILLSAFLERQRLFRRASNLWSGCFLALFFTVLFGNIWFTARSDAWPSAAKGVWLVVFFGFLLACILVSYLMNKHLVSRHALLCPMCGTKLVGAAGQIAVATKNCPGCGQKVIDD